MTPLKDSSITHSPWDTELISVSSYTEFRATYQPIKHQNQERKPKLTHHVSPKTSSISIKWWLNLSLTLVTFTYLMTIDSSTGFWDIIYPGALWVIRHAFCFSSIQLVLLGLEYCVWVCVCVCVGVLGMRIEMTCSFLGHITSQGFDLIPSSIWDLIFGSVSCSLRFDIACFSFLSLTHPIDRSQSSKQGFKTSTNSIRIISSTKKLVWWWFNCRFLERARYYDTRILNSAESHSPVIAAECNPPPPSSEFACKAAY